MSEKYYYTQTSICYQLIAKNIESKNFRQKEIILTMQLGRPPTEKLEPLYT